MNPASVSTLRCILARDKLDALLVTKAANIEYLSRFDGEGQLLITLKDKFLITDFRYQEAVRKKIKSFQIHSRESFVPLEESLSALTKRLKIKRMGFEAQDLNYATYRRLHKTLNNLKLISTKNVIERLRAIKTDQEIALIKKVAYCALASFTFAKNFIKPGKTECEIADAIQYFMKKMGAEGSAFDTIIASGKRASQPHARVSTRSVKKNDAVLIDLGCRKSGYNSDLTRVIFLGKMSGKIKKIYQIVIRAQQLAIEAVRAGEQIYKIDKIARQYIAKEGFGPYFGHALGHGIGREVHEYPSISPKNHEVLKAGMVFTIEPGIYIPGWGGIRIEDMILVTKNGSQILTKVHK